ncbi:MAG TPA: hypothetical protein DSN98_08730 [Thermoplasmata archaeon]|nr:MAG TPA: hypothetical protein DSN98_08730 [Thermoplasmata archaeon]
MVRHKRTPPSGYAAFPTFNQIKQMAYEKMKRRKSYNRYKTNPSEYYTESRGTTKKSNPNCPYCGTESNKNGFIDTLNEYAQRYKCKSCNKTFTDDKIKELKKGKPAINVKEIRDPLTGEITIKKKTSEELKIESLQKEIKALHTQLGHKETDLKNLRKTLNSEIKELKKEIEHLKKTGFFPSKKGETGNNGTANRFSTIEVV